MYSTLYAAAGVFKVLYIESGVVITLLALVCLTLNFTTVSINFCNYGN